MSWLAIHLPLLPLQSLPLQPEDRFPLAVTATGGRQQQILVCNAAAAALGVSAGMPVGAARALSLQLRLLPHDAPLEHAALQGLALWGGRFSSQISLAPPRSLLLELGGSRRLFGGVSALLRLIRCGLSEMGYCARLCLAPTAVGALLLAQSGRDLVIRDLPGLRQALAPLPLQSLPLAEERKRALEAAGADCLGDLLRLPWSGLARRLGPSFVDYLRRLLGQAADPRPLFRPPDLFRRQLQLPAEVRGVEALMFAARRLILELCGFLAARQAGTRQLCWVLYHDAGRRSAFRLGLLSLERDPERLQQLLRERLERLSLPAPVQAIALRVDDLLPLHGRPLSLFQDADRNSENAGQLLQRLLVRLGPEQVGGIRVLPDHRPEQAWCHCPPGQAGSVSAAKGRPLWLLAIPLRLAQRGGWPCRGGRLRLEPERERIECGWWDGRPVARDYFVAYAPRGEKLWVYRELKGRREWYLHGLF